MKLISFIFLTLIIVGCSKDWSEYPLVPTPTTIPTETPIPVPTETPEEEIFTGFIPPKEGGLTANAHYIVADRKASHPVRFSWLSLGYDIPVRNQGRCGSCWAQASEGVLEFAIKIYLDKSEQLSVQQLVSCDRNSHGCNGGWFADSYVLGNGLAKESDFPYQAKNLSCKSGLTPFATPIEAVHIGQKGRKPTITELKDALMQFGPLSIDVAAGRGWSGYKGGILGPCTNKSINHMIILLGWDDTKGVWIVRNSWGEKWGEKGNGLIPYGCDRIAEDAATFLVKPLQQY